jgi:hypothetical protein
MACLSFFYHRMQKKTQEGQQQQPIEAAETLSTSYYRNPRTKRYNLFISSPDYNHISSTAKNREMQSTCNLELSAKSIMIYC